MAPTELALIVVLEVAALLAALLFFLLRDRRRRLAQIETLRERVGSLRRQVRAEQRQKAPQSIPPAPDYTTILEDLLEQTRDYHSAQAPGGDIALDLDQSASPERRAAALRHSFLIAEKQARRGGETDWAVLTERLEQVRNYLSEAGEQGETATPEPAAVASPVSVPAVEQFEAAGTDGSAGGAELDALRQRVANLERFKTLYFELEAVLREGQEDTEDEDSEQLLKRYREKYAEVERILLREQDRATGSGSERGPGEGIGRQVIANQQELERVRNMAVDQHKLIERLRQRLSHIESDSDRDGVIADLAEQLDRQERYLRESEMCSELLERELSSALQRSRELEEHMQGRRDGDVQRLEALVEELTEEGRQLLKSLALVSEEDGASGNSRDDESGPGIDAQELQSQLDALRLEYAQLEERYINLKTAG